MFINSRNKFFFGLVGILFTVANSITPARASEFTSASFKVLDPVISVGGAMSTSTSYQTLSSLGQVAVGTSTAPSFELRGGYDYFPVATAPALSATPGDGQVSLSWTASTGFLGWTVTSYDVCYGTASNSYGTCADEGNVTSKTVTGLASGTTYFFRVRAKTVFGVVIVRSNEASATTLGAPPAPAPVAAGVTSVVAAPATGINLFGRAYPKSTVVLLKDAQIVSTMATENGGFFQIQLSGLTPGNYIFSLWAEDKDELRSALFAFPASIASGKTISIGGILIAPTLRLNKLGVRRGEDVEVSGQSASNAEITIGIGASLHESFIKVKANEDGVYYYKFNTASLDEGEYFVRAKSALDGSVSPFSKVANFAVGKKTILVLAKDEALISGDINNDKKVNLLDFSIVLYWYKKLLPPAKVDLNFDGTVDILDFSILAYYWTG